MGDRRCGERVGVEQFREGLVPREWRGPNIGGGALQLLFYIGIVASLFLIGSALRRNRRGSK